MFEKVKQWFSKSYIDEEDYIDGIIAENDRNPDNKQIAYSIDVVRYTIDLNSNLKYPNIVKVCNFSGELLPELNSIIWGPDATHKFMLPYRVVRIDFLEDEENGVSTQHRVMIIVKPATIDLVITTY